MDDRIRCGWPMGDAMLAYHDTEWGVIERDDRALYEKLCLDGFQAGLSWKIVLDKREGFRRVFEGFDPVRVAAWDAAHVERALTDAGIVRNRAKVLATVANAQAFLRLAERGLPFHKFLWDLAGGRRVVNAWTSLGQLPVESAESRAMAKGLKQAGFKFCGPTICYAFMQAVGLVNDHLVTCFRYGEV